MLDIDFAHHVEISLTSRMTDWGIDISLKNSQKAHSKH